MEKIQPKEMVILSPDRIPIHPEETYKTLGEAMTALWKWIERYEIQGYYSSNDYGRIRLEELHQLCTIELIENLEDTLPTD